MTGTAQMTSVFAPSPVVAGTEGVIVFSPALTTDRLETDDERLAAAISGGDEAALEEAYGRWSGPVFAFLSRRMADRSTAEDVLQQVFIEVWQKADRFDAGRGTLQSWIFAIANSRSLDVLRKRVPSPVDPVGDGFSDSVDGEGIDEMEEFMASWNFARLVDGLPEEEAELLRMRFNDDLSQTEISRRTGVPLGTVKSRMVSGLTRLRTEMEASR
jgi:RNA polymerase sigma-70 factor (ECF subfamily)